MTGTPAASEVLHGRPTTSLHLCNSHRQLLVALADALRAEASATVIYLDDDLPLAPPIRARIEAICPGIEFLWTSDRREMAAYARLPRWLPALIRRNLSLARQRGGGLRLLRPADWVSATLGDRRFDVGHVYHAGFFMAKVVAGRCSRVVLRESGLHNYATLPVPPLKALVRLISGLAPHRQIWGEERWIDVIEVAHPERLPAALRHKARRFRFADIGRNGAPDDRMRRLAALFLPEAASLPAGPDAALILGQPIDAMGLCSTDAKAALYAGIARRLATGGYRVLLKPHPRDPAFRIDGVQTLPPDFPIEIWPFLSDRRFALAVAICSAALDDDAGTFADAHVQLVAAPQFNRAAFTDWPATIDRALASALAGGSEQSGTLSAAPDRPGALPRCP